MPSAARSRPGQPTVTDVDLVLEGGGVKGIGLVGAIGVLAEAGYRFRRVAGASAGSIVGSLVAARMPADELTAVMAGLDYRRLGDSTWLARVPLIGSELSLWFHQGVHRGDYLYDFVADHLAGCGVHTFADLRDDDLGGAGASAGADEDRYRFIAHVADISRSRLLRLPWDYRPVFGLRPEDQRVADCVRASASLPIFYVPVRLRSSTGDVSWLVDGGVMSDFPIEVFDPPDGTPEPWRTVGIKLSARQPANEIDYHVRNLPTFGQALVGSMSGWYDRMVDDRPSVVERTIFVDCFGIRSTDLDISSADKRRLYDSGRRAAEAWLETQQRAGTRG